MVCQFHQPVGEPDPAHNAPRHPQLLRLQGPESEPGPGQGAEESHCCQGGQTQEKRCQVNLSILRSCQI